MNSKRRKLLQVIGGSGVAAVASPLLSFPALAQNTPLRIGIIAPKAGIAGTIGECELRGRNRGGRRRRRQDRLFEDIGGARRRVDCSHAGRGRASASSR